MVGCCLDCVDVSVAGVSAGCAEPLDGADSAIEESDVYWTRCGRGKDADDVVVYCESVMAYY